MEQTNSENIVEALKLLDHTAKQKKGELKMIISDKYSHLQSLINENENALMTSWATAKDRAIQAATNVKNAGIEKARGIAGGVDESVRSSPWLYIAGTATVGLLLGYILGRNHQAPRNGNL